MILEKEEDEDYDIRQITVRESESFLCRLGPSDLALFMQIK